MIGLNTFSEINNKEDQPLHQRALRNRSGLYASTFQPWSETLLLLPRNYA